MLTRAFFLVFYGGDACLRQSFVLSRRCQCRVLSIDYRMPPDHPFPKAVTDVISVWKELLSNPSAIPGVAGPFKAENMAMYGMSAGGGLSAAAILYLKDQKLPLPAAVGLYTPWVELGNVGDSRWTNMSLDLALFQHEGILGEAGKLYAGSYSLTHPYVSPVYGDPKGWPPTIFVGTIASARSDDCSSCVRAHFFCLLFLPLYAITRSREPATSSSPTRPVSTAPSATPETTTPNSTLQRACGTWSQGFRCPRLGRPMERWPSFSRSMSRG